MADDRITDALEDLTHALENQALNAKEARKADKAILDEIKRKNKYDPHKNAGVRAAKKVGKGAYGAGKSVLGAVGKAAGGFVANEIGGIPIAGAIFRILGKKFANASLERKQYKKTLIIRRKLELKEVTRMEKVKAKLDARREEAEAKVLAAKKLEDAQKDAGGAPTPEGEQGKGGKGNGIGAAAEKMSNAAMELQATVISFTPAIQTFHETVQKMSEIVDKQFEEHNNPQPLDQPAQAPNKVHDAQLLEILHSIENLAQENTVTAEEGQGILKTMGKDIGNIKWHTARQNGSVGRIEKLINAKSAGKLGESTESPNNKITENIAKDVGTIKWHVARLNGSSGRSEKLLMTAAADRIKEMAVLDEQLKIQKKLLDTAEEQEGISLISGIASLLGGVSGLMATGLITSIVAALPEILAGGAVVAAAGGLAVAVHKLAPNLFGKSDGNAQDASDNLDKAQQAAKEDGSANDPMHNDPGAQQYAKQNGRFPTQEEFKQQNIKNFGSNALLDGTSAGANVGSIDRSNAESATHDYNIGANSAAVAEGNKASGSGSGGNVVSSTSVNNNSTTVQSSPVSPTPSGAQPRFTIPQSSHN